MSRVPRKRVTMSVTVSVPVGISGHRARQEVRAVLEGHTGYSDHYVVRGEGRYFDEDGGLKVVSVKHAASEV